MKTREFKVFLKRGINTVGARVQSARNHFPRTELEIVEFESLLGASVEGMSINIGLIIEP